MKIHESAENYLEAVYMIKKERGCARSIDVATRLGVSKPSVSVAMKTFREEGFITVDENGGLNLTKKGTDVAEKMYERHEIIARALIGLGVEPSVAYEDSCKIEHDISDQAFEKIKEHMERHTKTR